METRDGEEYLRQHHLQEFTASLLTELKELRPNDPYGLIVQRARAEQAAQIHGTADQQIHQRTSSSPAKGSGTQAPGGPEFGWNPFPQSLSRPTSRVPPLHILILLVGSQGDVQPFVAFGLGLQKRGHEVRIAAHVQFRDFVKKHGLDYFPLKGDPQELMLFMVNHPDMVTLSQREIEMKKHTMREIYDSTYMACTTSPSGDPYAPDVLICNPPCNTHVHLHEKLQIPLHIIFTMPWSGTKDYQHPFASATLMANTTLGYGNKQSFSVIDEITWMGLSPQINGFRKEILQLPPIDHGASLVDWLEIPQTYCMSKHLVPKPSDWGPHIDVVGFWFLDGKTDFKPEEAVPELAAFLRAGPPPFYVGFGSIVTSNPRALSEAVVDGVIQAGVRAILHQGWAKLGDGLPLPPKVFLLDKAVPHDWLFPQCLGVCHHGGAGTVAAGLRCGRPTVVVPFFGDQGFWGDRVASMGVGPQPIPKDELTGERLAQAIAFCIRPEVRQAAADIGAKITAENGVEAGIDAFEAKLPFKDGKWTCEVWQSQRWYLGLGWCSRTVNDAPYTEATGWQGRYMENFPCPAGWQWNGPWVVEVTPDTDADGWMYGTRLKGKAGITSTARKRRWVRTRSLDPDFTALSIPKTPSRDGMDSTRPTLVYLTIKEGRNFPVHERTYLKMWVRRGEGRSQKQRTKVVKKDPNPVWNQTFFWCFLLGDFFVLRHYDWNTIRDTRLESYEVDVRDLDLHSPVPLWVSLSGDGGQVLLQWHLGT